MSYIRHLCTQLCIHRDSAAMQRGPRQSPRRLAKASARVLRFCTGFESESSTQESAIALPLSHQASHACARARNAFLRETPCTKYMHTYDDLKASQAAEKCIKAGFAHRERALLTARALAALATTFALQKLSGKG